MTTDLEKAIEVIKAKEPILTNFYKYVNGPQPLRYSTERLEDAFEDIKVHFEINWCAVVVDATNDRLGVSGFQIGETTANKWMEDQFEKMEVAIESQKVHKAALGYTQGYLIIWKNDQDEVEIYYNDPRMVEVFYDPDRPKKKLYAAKWFVTADPKVQEMTLYYPDRIEHWQARLDKQSEVKAKSFKLASSDPNPYGVIPVFEFYCEGEITRVLTLQDAVNKMFSDMMVAGEFGAFTQRWIVSQADPSDLKNSPGQVWWIPAADGQGQQSSVGEFGQTDLGKYLDAMDRLATSLFIITRTPKHYLVSAGASISGEALIAMEAPFVKKVDWYKKRFTPFWKDAAKFILQLGGYAVDSSMIEITWARSESTQPLTEAQTGQTWFNTGLPLVTILRRMGWSEPEITNMLADMKKEKKEKLSVAQATLEALRNETASENPGETPEEPAE